MTKSTPLTLVLGGEKIEIEPTPALFLALDENCDGLLTLVDKIEGHRLRHAEIVDALEVLARSRLHREEIEASLVEEGVATALATLARLMTVYMAGMKRLEALFPPGEETARD